MNRYRSKSKRKGQNGKSSSKRHKKISILKTLRRKQNKSSVISAWHVVNAFQNKDEDELQKMLLKMDTNTLNKKVSGATLLAHAVRNGSEAMVHTLLIMGADPWICNEDEELPVHEAILGHRFDCLETLLKLRSDLLRAEWSAPRFHLPCTWTLVGFAMEKKCYIVLPTLARLGARLDPLCNRGWSALDYLLSDESVCMDTLQFFLRNDTVANPVIYNPYYDHATSHRYEKKNGEVNKSLCFRFLMYSPLRSADVKAILSQLSEQGYEIMRDPFIQWIIQERRKEMHTLTESFQTNKDVIRHIFENFSALEILQRYAQPWVCIFRMLRLRNHDIGQILKECVEESFQVKKLSSLCRISIRRRLSGVHRHRALGVVVPKLPLPNMMHKFLLLKV